MQDTQSKGTHKCSDNLIELYYPSLSLLYMIIGTTILLGPGGRSGFTILISHVTFEFWSSTWLGFLWFCSRSKLKTVLLRLHKPEANHDHNNANPDISKSSLRLIMPVMWPKTVCVLPVNPPPLFRESLLKNTSNFFAFVPQCLFTCKDGTKMRASGIVGAWAYMFNLTLQQLLVFIVHRGIGWWSKPVYPNPKKSLSEKWGITYVLSVLCPSARQL